MGDGAAEETTGAAVRAHEVAVQLMAEAIRDRNEYRCGVCDGRVYGGEADYDGAARRALAALVQSPEVWAAMVEALVASPREDQPWRRHVPRAERGASNAGHHYDAFCDLCSGEPDRILNRLRAALTPGALTDA